MRLVLTAFSAMAVALAISLPGCVKPGGSEILVSSKIAESEQELITGGGTWVVLGDSLTGDNPKSHMKRYYDYVAEDLGCTVVNKGEGGTGYKSPGWSASFYDRAKTMDLDGVDCLTIFGSFNDLGKGYDLGTANDETLDTIGGCMNLTIKELIHKAPTVRIGIVTPTPWKTNLAFNAEGEALENGTSREECNEYVRLLKKVANKYRLPILDLYETCGFNPDDQQVREVLYATGGEIDQNGVHPGEEGHRFMYPAWREFVKTLMPSVRGE